MKMITESINDKGVYRTATPGLLISVGLVISEQCSAHQQDIELWPVMVILSTEMQLGMHRAAMNISQLDNLGYGQYPKVS